LKEIITLLSLAVALGIDAFSLCLGVGITALSWRQIIIVTITFFLYHVFMPLIGWFMGDFFGHHVERYAVLLGALMLTYLGTRMTAAGWPSESVRQYKGTWRTFSLVTTVGVIALGAGVSMDALTVGFTLGAIGSKLFTTAIVIGLVAGIMTFSGLILGRFVSRWVGERAQMVGGIILIMVGLYIATGVK